MLIRLLSNPNVQAHCEVIECASEEQWLDYRKELVTASDIAMLLGRSPWGSRMDLLTRKLEDTKIAVSAPMVFGTKDEDHNRKVFSELSGIPTVGMTDIDGGTRVILRSRRWPHLGATLDGFFIKPGFILKDWGFCFPDNNMQELRDELAENMNLPFGCLEMKQTEIFSRKKWGGGRDPDSLYPEHYGIQAQAQLAVTGLDTNLLVCKLGTSKMVIRPVYEDVLLHEEIGQAVEEFWKELESLR